MEIVTKTILLGMAAQGQTISKNSTVSIGLILVLLGGVWIVATSWTSTENRIQNLETQNEAIHADLETISENQQKILNVLSNEI